MFGMSEVRDGTWILRMHREMEKLSRNHWKAYFIFRLKMVPLGLGLGLGCSGKISSSGPGMGLGKIT
jgi:hypothetical protein